MNVCGELGGTHCFNLGSGVTPPVKSYTVKCTFGSASLEGCAEYSLGFRQF